MVKSQDETLLAVISGKKLIKNEQKINQLFIFKRIKDKPHDRFEQTNRIVLRDFP